jgi:hypothetical protein
MLKAAAGIGHPPTAVIFSNPKHKKWTMWDYRLIKAHYILQDWYRDGVPLWWDESDRVTFDAKARFSKSRASIERAQEADSKKKSKSFLEFSRFDTVILSCSSSAFVGSVMSSHLNFAAAESSNFIGMYKYKASV